ncbi:MAG: fused MFS/spermidine synthase [Acidobacteria bacterium]|nr:fused MFS/spermidine synthase [Acidobacteriota bacterium]
MKDLYIYLVVFLAGAAVLAIELLGTRILGPFYGVSLFLWSALITVTLIALSIGYALGGRWADRGATMTRLYFIIAGAGLWTLFIPWIQRPVLVITEPFSLRLAVLAAAFVLFVPPLTLLGMVSPYAIKLRASNLSIVGRTAGDLYAISTVGSVVSALLTGFFLIPNFGVTRLTFLIGITLLLIGSIGLLAERRFMAIPLAAIGIFSIIMAFWLLPSEGPDPERGLIAVEQSPYAEIRVLDMERKRHLIIDGGVHTIVDPLSWESRFPYTAVIDLTRDFFQAPGDLLLIGLGGGSIVKRFARERWAVEAVEIDPVVVRVAQEHFGLEPWEGTIHPVDGRQFLITHDKTYDVIVMDAFGSSSIPFHLVTKESFGLIASHLKGKGIFALNVETNGWDSLIVRSLSATLKEQFDFVLALPTYEPASALGNVILLAAHFELELPHELEREFPARDDRVRILAWDNRFEADTKDAQVLTDDLNPVDLWAEEINLAARRDLHRYFQPSGLSW